MIPIELLGYEIGKYLSPEDLPNYTTVFPQLKREDVLWKQRLERDFGLECKEDCYETYKRHVEYMNQMRIPVEKVDKSSTPEKFDILLEKMGFVRRGMYYRWENQDVLLAYSAMNQRISNLYSDKMVEPLIRYFIPNVIELLPILPKYFEKTSFYLSFGPNIGIYLKEFAEVYDFYHGQNSFWYGYKKRVNKSFYQDLLSVDNKYILDVILTMKEMVYMNRYQ